MSIRRLLFAIIIIISLFAVVSCGTKTVERDEIYYKTQYTSVTDVITSSGKYGANDFSLNNYEKVIMNGGKMAIKVALKNKSDFFKPQANLGAPLYYTPDGRISDENSLVEYAPLIYDSLNAGSYELTKKIYEYSYGGFVIYDIASGNAEFIEIKDSKGNNVVDSSFEYGGYDFMPDGRFMVNYQTIKWILSDEVNEYGIRPVKHIGNSYAIAFIEPDGLLSSRIVLDTVDERMHDLLTIKDEYSIQQIRAAADGSIYIRTYERIIAITPKDDGYALAGFVKLEDIPDFTENPIFGYNVALDRTEDGNVYLKYPYKAADGRTFYRRCELTPTENPVGEPETLPYLGGNDTIISGDDVYYKTGSGIYYAGKIDGESLTDDVGADDIYDMNSNIVCYWSDIDLYGGMVNYIHVVSKDEIIAEVTDPDTGEDMFVRATTSDTPVDDRKVLILAYEDGSRQLSYAELQKTVRRFNRSNEDYRVRTVDYRTDENSTANDKLMREIVSGSTPDIVLLGGTITPEIFIRQKAFVNLYDFMKKDNKYTKDAFLPAALKPFENDGKLYYLTTGIIPETIVCDKSVYNGKTFGSAEDLAAISDAAREIGIPLFRSDDKTTPAQPVFSKLLDGVLSESVDYESGKVKLGKDFAEFLRICGEADYAVSDANYYTLDYYEQKAALSFLNMYGIEDYLQQRTLLAKDFSDLNTVGYPVEGGTIIRIASSLAITNRSDDKEGAWEFMKYWLDTTEERCERAVDNIYELNGMFYFPTTRAAMDNLFTAVKKSYMTIDTFASADGRYTAAVGYLRNPVNTLNLPPDCIYFTDEDEAYLRDLFETAVTPANADTKLIGIVKEETAAYFAGAQTLDRTVEIISDRVKTRLAE